MGGGAAQSGEAAYGPHGVERWVGHPVCGGWVGGGGGGREGVGGGGQGWRGGWEAVGRRRGRKNQEVALRSREKRLMARIGAEMWVLPPVCGGVGVRGDVGEGGGGWKGGARMDRGLGGKAVQLREAADGSHGAERWVLHPVVCCVCVGGWVERGSVGGWREGEEDGKGVGRKGGRERGLWKGGGC